jgi:hypothetical protein
VGCTAVERGAPIRDCKIDVFMLEAAGKFAEGWPISVFVVRETWQVLFESVNSATCWLFNFPVGG